MVCRLVNQYLLKLSVVEKVLPLVRAADKEIPEKRGQISKDEQLAGRRNAFSVERVGEIIPLWFNSVRSGYSKMLAGAVKPMQEWP